MPAIYLMACSVADQECGSDGHIIAISRFPCVLGRASECDHRINDPMISRRHCSISFRDGQMWIEDLESLNGTRIDGQPVLAPHPVVDGAALQLAHSTFVVRLEGFSREDRLNPDRLAGARTGEHDGIS